MASWRHGPKPLIGLIGGIGAGKSSAARCFEQRGGSVVDADSIGHLALVQPEIVEKILSKWGQKVARPDGSLDRRAIGKIVFENSEERHALEAIVFPYIGERCQKLIAAAQNDPNVAFVVLDAAVMLEAGWNDIADRIVYVEAPPELRLERVVARSGWTEEDLRVRESAQWSAEAKKARAHAILVNDAGHNELQEQVDRLLDGWKLLSA